MLLLNVPSCWSPSRSTSLWSSSRWSCSRQISVSVYVRTTKFFLDFSTLFGLLSWNPLPLTHGNQVTMTVTSPVLLFLSTCSSSSQRTEGVHKPPPVDGLRRCRAEWSHSGAGAVRGRLQGRWSHPPPLRQVPKRTERYSKTSHDFYSHLAFPLEPRTSLVPPVCLVF